MFPQNQQTNPLATFQLVLVRMLLLKFDALPKINSVLNLMHVFLAPALNIIVICWSCIENIQQWHIGDRKTVLRHHQPRTRKGAPYAPSCA